MKDRDTKTRAIFLAALMFLCAFSGTVAFTSGVAAQSGSNVQFTGPGVSIYQGQDVVITGGDISANNDYILRSVDAFETDSTGTSIVESSSQVEDLTLYQADSNGESPDLPAHTSTIGTNEYFLVADTADRDANNYFVRGGALPTNPGEDSTFEVVVQDISIEFDENDVPVADKGDASIAELEIDSNRIGYNANISAAGDLNEEELTQIFVSFANVPNSDTATATTPEGEDVTVLNDGTFSTGDAVSEEVLETAIVDLRGNVVTNTDGDLQSGITGTTNVENAAGGTTTISISDVMSTDANPFNVLVYSTTEDESDDYDDGTPDEKIVLQDISNPEFDIGFADTPSGDYEFSFNVMDTEAGASDAVTVFNDIDQSNLTYTFEIPNDGEMHSLGIPGETEGTLADIVDPTAEGYAVFRFADGEWIAVTDFEGAKLNALDAIAIATEGASGQPDTFSLEVEFATQSATTVPPEKSLTEGWNFVTAPQRGDADRVLAVQHSFLVLDRFNEPSSEYQRGVSKFNTHYIGSDSHTVSPFKGYYVYAEDDTTLPGVLTGVQTRTDVNEQLDLDTLLEPQNSQDELAEARARINELEDDKAELEDDIDDLESEVSSLNSEVSDLKTENSNLEEENNQLTEDLNQCQTN